MICFYELECNVSNHRIRATILGMYSLLSELPLAGLRLADRLLSVISSHLDQSSMQKFKEVLPIFCL